MSDERDRNRLNIHEIKELSSYPRTAFLSTDCLSTRIVYLPMRCLSTRIVFLPTDSSYQRIVFLPTDCLPTNGLSSYMVCLPTRTVFLPTDSLSTNGPSVLLSSLGLLKTARSPGPSHAWGTVTRAVTRSVTRLGHSHQGGIWMRCLATSPSRSRTACFFFYRVVEKEKKKKKKKKKKKANCDVILYRQSHQLLFEQSTLIFLVLIFIDRISRR